MFEPLFVKMYAPLFSTPLFPQGLSKTDRHNHMRQLEWIALKGMKFDQIKRVTDQIVEVYYRSYSRSPLYTDIRFLTCDEQTQQCYEKDPLVLHQKLLDRLGTRYLWGGNAPLGVDEMNLYYPGDKDESSFQSLQRRLVGLDCSGLLFDVTCGFTPRNTSELYDYGRGIEIIQPLDLIVYPGHVIIALDRDRAIQNKENRGVFISSLDKELYYVRKKHPEYQLRRFL